MTEHSVDDEPQHDNWSQAVANSVKSLVFSAAGVEDECMLSVTPAIQIPETEFEFSFARSGGPGGQNVNKVNSKAVLHWDVVASESLPVPVRQRFLDRYQNRITKDGLLVLHSQKYRDQGRNVADCLDRLRDMLLSVAKPPVKRRPSKPSRGAKQRRLRDKKQLSEKKQSRRRPSMND